MAQTQKLYTRTWKNTGMEGTPIYVFQLADPNGTLGDAVGDIIMLSEDTSRKYIIHSYGVEIAGTDMVAYFEDAEAYAECGFTPKDMMTIFVESCEEVFHKGYTDVYHDEIANAMDEFMGFECERCYDFDTYEDYIRVYREDFAQKMHIGENCVYCFSAESLVECMAECPTAKCSFKKEEVIMMYPDGSYDKDMAYVVYHNEEV